MPSIIAVTSIPSAAPGDASLNGKMFEVGNAGLVVIRGRCTAGSGKGWLLRWDPETSKWWPWGADAKTGYVDIDPAAFSELDGKFSTRHLIGRFVGGQFLFMVQNAVTLSDLAYQVLDTLG